jgi:hypothetical protein
MDNDAQEGFWQEFIKVEHGILTCPECRRNSFGDDCSPHVSWAGPEYKPGGVAFLLHYPESRDYEGGGSRDKRLRQRLQAFRASPTVENYRLLVSEAQLQMRGDPWSAWESWTLPVSRCMQDCLTIEHVVWITLIKHRKPGRESKGVKLPAIVQQEHGIQAHLKGELEILRPGAVVAVGLPAANAMDRLEGLWRVLRIKSKGASVYDAYKTRDQLRALGLCRRRIF